MFSKYDSILVLSTSVIQSPIYGVSMGNVSDNTL